MKKGTGILLIASALVLILIIIIVKSYSSLSSLKEDAINKEANIDVQLNRKKEQVSKLVVLSKSYIEDSPLFSEIDDILSKKDNDILEKSKTNDDLSSKLNELLELLREKGLYSNEELSKIINEILSCEKRIETAKNNYNEIVEKYNNKVKGFPSGIIAKIMGYDTRDSFENKVIVVSYSDSE